MESASVPAGAIGGHAARTRTSITARPRPTRAPRIDRQTLGILLFIVSEVMLFGAFFAAYFFLRVVVDPPRLAAGAVRAAGRGRRHQHGDPRLLELHDPLRAGVDPARQPHRPQARPRPDLAARRDLPLHPDQRVRPHRLQRPRPRLRLDLLRPHRPARRPRLRRPAAAQLRHDPRLPRPLRPRGQGPPRRRGARHLLALRRRHVDHRLRPVYIL